MVRRIGAVYADTLEGCLGNVSLGSPNVCYVRLGDGLENGVDITYKQKERVWRDEPRLAIT